MMSHDAVEDSAMAEANKLMILFIIFIIDDIVLCIFCLIDVCETTTLL